MSAEMAGEGRQETVRIICDYSRPRDKQTGAERWALRALRINTGITILPADKSNATLVLNSTLHYNQKFGAILLDPAYRSLAKDTTETVERKSLISALRSLYLQRFPSDYVLRS